MKTILKKVLLTLLTSISMGFAFPDGFIKKAADELAGVLEQESVLLMEDVVSVDGSVTTFSYAIGDELRTEISSRGICRLADRSSLETIMSERELELAGLVELQDEAALGKLLEVDYVLSAVIIELEQENRLSMKLVDANTSEVVYNQTLMAKNDESSKEYIKRKEESAIKGDDKLEGLADIYESNTAGSATSTTRDAQYYDRQKEMLSLKQKNEEAYKSITFVKRTLPRIRKSKSHYFSLIMLTYPDILQALSSQTKLYEKLNATLNYLELNRKQDYLKLKKAHSMIELAAQHDGSVKRFIERSKSEALKGRMRFADISKKTNRQKEISLKSAEEFYKNKLPEIKEKRPAMYYLMIATHPYVYKRIKSRNADSFIVKADESKLQPFVKKNFSYQHAALSKAAGESWKVRRALRKEARAIRKGEYSRYDVIVKKILLGRKKSR